MFSLRFFLTENVLSANKILTWLCLILHIKKEQNILELFLREGQDMSGNGTISTFPNKLLLANCIK